jgi:hypothetical protein
MIEWQMIDVFCDHPLANGLAHGGSAAANTFTTLARAITHYTFIRNDFSVL